MVPQSLRLELAPPARKPAQLPDPPLFDVTDIAKEGIEGSIKRFGLDELQLAPNAMREISADGLERLVDLPMRAGQLVPLIGYRREARGPVTVYEGQRRVLVLSEAKPRVRRHRKATRASTPSQPDRAAARPRAEP